MKQKTIRFAPTILAAAVLLPGTVAHATGIAAGTTITNTANATYNAGASTATVTSNTVNITVDELLNVAVATLSTTPATASAAPAVLAFSVTNSGNGNEAFNLTANPNVAGNSFNGTIVSVVLDSNNNGIYDAGVDTVIANGSASPVLAADAVQKVFVLVSLPAGVNDGDTSQVRLTATAVTGSGPVGTIFPGAGDGSTDAVVGLTGATANSLASLVASLANLTLTKSYTISNTNAAFGANPLPGSIITYTLVTHTTGTGTANNTHITDIYPTGTTYIANSITLNGAGQTDIVDGDTSTASGTGIDVGLGNVTGGSADQTITFKVKIN